MTINHWSKMWIRSGPFVPSERVIKLYNGLLFRFPVHSDPFYVLLTCTVLVLFAWIIWNLSRSSYRWQFIQGPFGRGYPHIISSGSNLKKSRTFGENKLKKNNSFKLIDKIDRKNCSRTWYPLQNWKYIVQLLAYWYLMNGKNGRWLGKR